MPIPATTLSSREAYAEKVRAALTRKEPAIRDAYDIWQGREVGHIDPHNEAWMRLVRHKCGESGDIKEACSDERLDAFRRGVETDLAPVLRAGKIDEFPIEKALLLLRELHARLTES